VTQHLGKIDVLDHGHVILRNVAGPFRRPDAICDADDTDPAQCARMSFGKTGVEPNRERDLKLNGYLMRNKHTTPFEMIQTWWEFKMPLFVARQYFRHRTATPNEESGRYIEMCPDFYIPEIVGGKAANKKQGQEDNLPQWVQSQFKKSLKNQCDKSYNMYKNSIDNGVAPEHARLFLHVNHYTRFMWRQDSHNLMHLLSLRDHPHAQIEAQIYARAMDTLLRGVLPETMELYDKYRRLG
jgi:thymidylate synthase (FAD)